MRRALASVLIVLTALSAPAAALAKTKPRHRKKKTTVVVKMPTQAQLATEQAQRVQQAMLLLEQQQANAAQDLGGGVFQGASIDSRYGLIQVTITVNGSSITDCKGTWDIDIPRSIQIDTAAFPQLQTDCIAVGSAKIHQISGATLSVDAFQASLQSALVRAHMSTVGAIQLGPY